MRQTPKDRPPQIMWAFVNGATGSVLAGSGDLRVTRSSAGNYPVTLPRSIGSNHYGVVVTSHPVSGFNSAMTALLSDGSFTVYTFIPNTAAFSDATFTVMVVTTP